MDRAGGHEEPLLPEKLLAIDGYWGQSNQFSSRMWPYPPVGGFIHMRIQVTLNGLNGFGRERGRGRNISGLVARMCKLHSHQGNHYKSLQKLLRRKYNYYMILCLGGYISEGIYSVYPCLCLEYTIFAQPCLLWPKSQQTSYRISLSISVAIWIGECGIYTH